MHVFHGRVPIYVQVGKRLGKDPAEKKKQVEKQQMGNPKVFDGNNGGGDYGGRSGGDWGKGDNPGRGGVGEGREGAGGGGMASKQQHQRQGGTTVPRFPLSSGHRPTFSSSSLGEGGGGCEDDGDDFDDFGEDILASVDLEVCTYVCTSVNW